MNSSERFRPYRRAHRQLRRALADALGCCARLDARDAAACALLADNLHALLDLYLAHQREEDGALHAPLRERAPRALLAFDAEHEEQVEAIGALRPLLDRLRMGAAHAEANTIAIATAIELELRMSQFIAEALAHMADEETSLTRALWQHFTDEQLRGFASALRATDSLTSLQTRGHELAAKDMT
jgi:hypothetical protein